AVSQPTITLPSSLLPASGAFDIEELWRAKPLRHDLEQALSTFMRHRRWFRSKARTIVSVNARDAIALGKAEEATLVVLVRVDFREGDPETYLMPIAHATGDELKELEQQSAHAIVARLERPGGSPGALYDAVYGK